MFAFICSGRSHFAPHLHVFSQFLLDYLLILLFAVFSGDTVWAVEKLEL